MFLLTSGIINRGKAWLTGQDQQYLVLVGLVVSNGIFNFFFLNKHDFHNCHILPNYIFHRKLLDK